jgi:hypothetical protein
VKHRGARNDRQVLVGPPRLFVLQLDVELEQDAELLGAGLEQRRLVGARHDSVVDVAFHRVVLGFADHREALHEVGRVDLRGHGERWALSDRHHRVLFVRVGGRAFEVFGGAVDVTSLIGSSG